MVKSIFLAATVFVAMTVTGISQDWDVHLPMILNQVPTATPTLAATSTPTLTPIPVATSTPIPTPTQPGVAWDCSYDKYNCSDFTTHAQAQAVFDYCWALTGIDIHKLDLDGDKIACESLP